MKIVFIPHLPTLYGRRYNLAKNLAEQGHEVHFIVWDMPYPLSFKKTLLHIVNSFTSKTYQESNNLFVHQVRRLPFFWPVINGILFKSQVKKIYKTERAQLIISQAFTNETEPPLEFPLVYDINDDHQAFADIYGSALYRMGYRLLGVQSVIDRQAKAALLVTVVSDKLDKFARQYNDNVIKIPNGVEAEAFNFQKKSIRLRTHSIIYISNFGKWSRLPEVIDSINALRQLYPDIHLGLVGDGTEVEKAKQQVRNLQLTKYITFYGRVTDRKTIFKLIANAEVCLNISEKNAFRDASSPIKVIEYSAFGKKVISSNLAEVTKLNFPNVVIFSSTKPNSLKETIERVFGQSSGTDEEGKKLAGRYTWEHLTKTLNSNLLQVLK